MQTSQMISVIREKTRKTLYSKWCGIKRRCNNKNDKSYPRYGGKGIKVSKAWPHFRVFFADMAPTYFEGASIDRIDNKKGYSKENCRWVKLEDQAKNKTSVPLYTLKGITLDASDWDKKLGFKEGTVRARIVTRKWSVKNALTTPKITYKGFSVDSRGLYRVEVKRGGKAHFIGRFKTKKEALEARSSFIYNLVK